MRGEKDGSGEEDIDVIHIREIIKNNLITLVVSVVVTIGIVLTFQYSLIYSIWELSYDMDFYFYLNQNANIYVQLISGGIEVGLSLMFISFIRIIRFAILLIYSLSLIFCIVFFASNFLIQTRYKIKYLIISNILILIISLTVCYYTLPTISSVIVQIGSFIEEMAEFTISDITNPLGILEPLFTIMKYFYLPILLNLFILFLISCSVQISIKYASRTREQSILIEER